jgi:hypothetical protein
MTYVDAGIHALESAGNIILTPRFSAPFRTKITLEVVAVTIQLDLRIYSSIH